MNRLLELARVFLRLGLTAFGGPAVHIARMQEICVQKYQWLSQEQFLDLLGVSSLLPGPSSTEVAMQIGYLRAQWLGLFVAGLCFIAPPALCVFLLAWGYQLYGAAPAIKGILYTFKPVLIAIFLQALWQLGRTTLHTKPLITLGASCFLLALWGINPFLLLLASGMAWAGLSSHHSSTNNGARALALFGALFVLLGAGWLQFANLPPGSLPHPPTKPTPLSFLTLFLTFLKMGATAMGSGYVLLAYLQRDLVYTNHWLTTNKILDAVAAGQITPGPVFTTATFLGYLLLGARGALLATVGIFLPAFVFVCASAPFVSRLSRWNLGKSFLQGASVAAVDLIACVGFQLAQAALVDAITVFLFLASSVALLRYSINPLLIIGVATIAGILKSFISF